MKIVVVGVGALGSHLVPLIRNLGAEIVVVDFDRVEAKNTLSQLHPVGSVGKLKVESLAGAMLLLHKLKIGKIPHKLVPNNVDQILGSATKDDLIVDCLDNGEARRLVQTFARGAHIPLLHGALAANGAFGRVAWDEGFVVDDAPPGAATCDDGEHLPFISVVSSYIARSVQIFVRTGKKTGFAVSPAGAIGV